MIEATQIRNAQESLTKESSMYSEAEKADIQEKELGRVVAEEILAMIPQAAVSEN